MEVKINREKKKILNENPRYIIQAEFMFGDGDGYETIEVVVPENELGSYKSYITALEYCNSAYPHGKGGYDDYEGVFEYNLFFESEIELDEFMEELGFNDEEIKNMDENMTVEDADKILKTRLDTIIAIQNPHDIWNYMPCYEGYTYSFSGYSITFIDAKGTEFPCSVSFTKEEKERCKIISETIR